MINTDNFSMRDGGASSPESMPALQQLWSVRAYGEKLGDYQMVSAWREAHKVPILPETVIPPLAIIAERDGMPVAFAVCCQSYGIGVCFLEWLTTAPGLELATSRIALEHVIKALAECTKQTHGLMFGYCEAAIAREAQRMLGFVAYEKPHFKLATRIDV